MKMLLEIDNRLVSKEEICIDNHNELYLMIYLQNFLSGVARQTLKVVRDEINIKYSDNIENILENDLKEKYFNRYFNEPETQPDKSDLKIVEKPEIKIKENEGRFDPAEIMQYRMMSSVYDSLGDALDDEDAEPKK